MPRRLAAAGWRRTGDRAAGPPTPRRRLVSALLAIALLAAVAAAPDSRAAPQVQEYRPRVRLTAPSEVVAGKPFRVSVLVQDRWGPEGPMLPRAGVDAAARLTLSCTDPAARLPAELRLSRGMQGRGVVEATLRTPGLQRVRAEGAGEGVAETAPIRVLEEAPGERVAWGDLHAHLHTPGAGHAGALDPGEYARIAAEALEFARDVGLLDFCALTPHVQTAGGLARERDGRSPWEELQRVVDRADDEGELVVFPGFEWQGEEGDHCVLLPRSGPLEAPADFGALADAVADRGGILTAHAVYLPSEFRRQPAALVAAEVTRDAQDMHAFGLAAIAAGLTPAFLGCSDTHGGAVGATSLTGVRVRELSRPAVLEAIRQRRTWATNGERIVLDVEVDAAGELPAVRVRAVGTAPIDVLEIFRNERSVAQVRGLGAGPEIELAWEDDRLLVPDCLADSVSYHVKVVQTTANRYDPSRRDVAISSPAAVRLEARHFDAAVQRAGGSGAGGAAVARLRDAWAALGPGEGRALRAEPAPGASFVGWPDGDIGALAAAAAELERIAAAEPSLAELARDAGALAGVARAANGAARVLAEARAAGADREALRERARASIAAAAEARRSAARWGAIERSWFAARLLAALPESALAATDPRPASALPAAVAGEEPVSELALPIDARLLADIAPPRERRRRSAELAERWGFTAPPAFAPGPPLRIRVVAEGMESARVAGDPPIPLEKAGEGWTALVPAARIPAPGDPPLRLELGAPAVVSAVHVEREDGSPFRPLGRVDGVRFVQQGAVAQVIVTASVDSVEFSLSAVVPGGEVPLWSGVAAPGDQALAFEERLLRGADRIRLRWGFAGWRRAGGVELPGHDAARTDAFGVLDDGRAVVGLAEELVIVDPVTGVAERHRYPNDRRHEPGREFCVASFEDGRTLVRGAEGPGGGWAVELVLDEGSWRAAKKGPEGGTVAPHPGGGYAWLTGDVLHHRRADGTESEVLHVDAGGRLLGFDPAGRPVVAASGQAIRLGRGTGGVTGRIAGPALALAPDGAVLTYAGLEGRHAEIACGIRVERALPDGSRTGPWPLEVKASPVLDPPVRVAVAPDGALLVLAGSTGWRREPDHDWWGAAVERWEPVWAGESRAARMSSP